MSAVRIALATFLLLLASMAGVPLAHAAESTSFRLFGELTRDAISAPSTSASFHLSEGGVTWEVGQALGTGEDEEEESEDGGGGEEAGSDEETVTVATSGGGGRRARPTGESVSVAEVRADPVTPVSPPSRATRSERVIAFVAEAKKAEAKRAEEKETPIVIRPRVVIPQPSLRPIAAEPGALASISPSVDLAPLVALAVQRRMIASMPLRFQDSWHRPRSIDILGSEIAAAYETYADTPAIRMARFVDLVNQNLLLSALLVFTATLLSVIGASPSIRQKCTTLVCVIERGVVSLQPSMRYGRLLLRIFLLSLSLGIFFWLTTVYAFAAATAPLRHMYNGRLLSSTGAALTSPHSIRFSFWTSADFVSGDTTGTGAVNAGASAYAGWNETQSVTPDSNGYFSVELGSVTALPTVDTLSVSTLLSLFLQIEVKAAGAADTAYELLDRDASSATVDRSPVLSVPFALNADMLDQRDVGTGSGTIPLLQSGGVLAKGAMPDGLTRDIFTIDTDDSAAEPALRFGQTLAKTLSYSNGSFHFDDDLAIAGSLTVDGAVILRSTLSGASAITFSALRNCVGLGTSATGALACAPTPVIVRKSADEFVSSSTALQDDDHLMFTIGTNETWAFSMVLIGDSGSTPDFQFAVTAPAGSTCGYSVNAENAADASVHTTCGEASDRMGGNGDNRPYMINGTVATGGTAGFVTLQWAQATSTAYSTTIRAGSWITAHRVQ